MEGILLVRKPAGWTSFDVVAKIRRTVAEAEAARPRSVKIGHSGTLDPFATGLLVLCVGRSYTRRVSELTKQDKTYDVLMRLGMTSTTGDPEGTLAVSSERVPPEAELQRVFSAFTGTLQQTPPVFSAVKIGGQRAYKLARAGKSVDMPVRTVTVRKLMLTSYEFPFVRFTADVSSGTYIRSLVADMGRELGTGAYTAELCRTRIGNYSLGEASDMASLDAAGIRGQLRDV